MAYYLKDLPFTEEGKMLKLSDEDRERFRLVYKREGDGWVLHDIYEKGGEYGEDCIVVPLESTYKGYTYIDEGKIFRNVKGTTNDPMPINPNTGYEYHSWIGLWKQMYYQTTGTNPICVCCTDGKVYETSDRVEYGEDLKGCQNTGLIVGGHVIRRKRYKSVNVGDLVYIVPICMSHDHIKIKKYMKTGQKTFAVKLNYKIIPQNYLARHPLETHEKI